MAAGFDRYLKASRNRPAKDIGGGTSIIATNTVHGPTQVRCMQCKGMCGASKTPDGRSVMRCSSCGYTFTSRVL